MDSHCCFHCSQSLQREACVNMLRQLDKYRLAHYWHVFSGLMATFLLVLHQKQYWQFLSDVSSYAFQFKGTIKLLKIWNHKIDINLKYLSVVVFKSLLPCNSKIANLIIITQIKLQRFLPCGMLYESRFFHDRASTNSLQSFPNPAFQVRLKARK